MKHTKLIAALLSGALLLTGCGSTANVNMEEAVMTIGDTDVSARVFNFFLTNYAKQLGDAEKAKDMALEQCKDNFLMVAVAKAMEIEFDEEKQKEISDYKQQIVDSHEGEYDEFLTENGITDEDIDTIISVSYYAEALEDKLEDKEFTDEEKKAYFKEHYRRAKHILISAEGEDKEAEKKAQELLEKAQNGEDFDALIADNSEDPGSKSNPDGYVFTDDEMVPEFQDGVDSIGVGEFTLVKSDYGYHVIQRLALDETPEYFEQAYADAADAVEAKMESSRLEDQIRAWAEEYGIETTVNDALADKLAKAASKQK